MKNNIHNFYHLHPQKTIILGINNNEDASAALIVNGVVLAAVQEERFTRNKLEKCWPKESINFVLDHAGLEISDIDIIAYGVAGEIDSYDVVQRYTSRIREESTDLSRDIIERRIDDEIAIDNKTIAELYKFLSEYNIHHKLLPMSHHDCHALGAYTFSPFEDALAMSSDGRGDFESLSIHRIEKSNTTKLHSELTVDSMGYFYSMITVALGYRAYRHEGKVTGLAAHGSYQKSLSLMKQMIDIQDGKIRSFCGELYNPSMNTLEDLSEILKKNISEHAPEDIAAGAQHHLENTICAVLEQYLNSDAPCDICLGGGTFGNVLLNQKISELPGIRNVYVIPFMGDGGLSACAAGLAHFRLFKTKPTLASLFLGPEATSTFDKSKIVKELPVDIDIRTVENLAQAVANMIAENKVIAMVKGRMEFGPRSLCNRSIIYHAADPSVNTWLNERLNRTEFMPFAPVTPANLANDCYIDWTDKEVNTKHMTITVDCSESMKKLCPAAVHIDGTARPQVIFEEEDKFMYDILNSWYFLTGQPSLINTSYNRHEEPIVCNLTEALSPLIDGIVDGVVLNGKYILTREEKIPQNHEH